jgi:transketolase
MDEYKIKRLEELSKEAKRKIIKISAKAKAPHVGSCLSVIDILISIYFDIFDNELSPEKFKSKEAPAIILSKGHASAALYTVLFLKGYISEEQLFTYHEDNGLPGHVTTSVNGVYFSTGSLGHGLAVGCGMALANKLDKKNKNVIVIMSDGEIEEGSVWEAANFAAIKKLNNLIGVIDNNGLQGYSKFSDVFYGSIDEKFRAFGW